MLRPSHVVLLGVDRSQDYKESNLKDANVWKDGNMPVAWRKAIYEGEKSESNIMGKLYAYEKEFMMKVVQEYGGKENCSYIEVGCGTAELGSYLYHDTKYSVGIEINPAFLDLAKRIHPELASNSSHAYFLEGNALYLKDLVSKNLPKPFWKTRRVVSILMNTLGILPPDIRSLVISQMIEVAGDDGVVVVGCWHQPSLPLGIEHLYKKHPELCGEITDDMYNLETGDLYVPSTSYSSHWWLFEEILPYFSTNTTNTEKEVNEDTSSSDLEINHTVKGVGIFVTAKKRKSSFDEPPSKKKIDNPVWEQKQMPLIWREAMYVKPCKIMKDLFSTQREIIFQFLGKDKENACFTEVGCGSAEMGSHLINHVKYNVGVELNPDFISLAKKCHKQLAESSNTYLIEGNAIYLESLICRTLPDDYWQTQHRVVACLMNTFGILPESIRIEVLYQMILAAGGNGGCVILGCWHKESLRVGVEEFYKPNPRLVGEEVTSSMCNFDTGNLEVPSSGYKSHWWSEEELKETFNSMMNLMKEKPSKDQRKVIMDIKVIGIGIFMIMQIDE